MAARQTNPFKPTAGMNPPELIGRDEILDEFAEALANGPGAPDRLMRISGVRGVGKTVLLNALGDVARSFGFHVVDVASNKGFCNRILDALTRSPEFSSTTIAPALLGISLGTVELSKSPTRLGEAMLRISKRGGLLITLDEIQDAPLDELRELGNEIQLLIRQEANVAFAFAGLPTAVDDAIGADTLTFLQRAKHVELAKLADFEVGESIEETVQKAGKQIDAEASKLLTDAASGYPFMIQLVGYYAWQAASRRESPRISVDDALRGIEVARKSFNAMVIEPALRRLPQRQLDYLVAMAGSESTPISSGEVAQRMGLSTKDVSSYRKRLIDAGIIETRGYGKVDFAIPYMRDYLLENVEEFA